MSKSVVPAAAKAKAVELERNKQLAQQAEGQARQADDHKPAAQEAAADQKLEEGVVVDNEQVQSMDDASTADLSLAGDFSFDAALADADFSIASFLSEVETADQEGFALFGGDDGDSSGGFLLVGALVLVGLGGYVLFKGDGDKNDAPVFTSGGTATIAENAAATTAVYTSAATDPDGDTLTYTLSGTDAAAFNVSNAGVVTLKAPADFETKSSYSFNVVASDGELTATRAVVLTVTNVGPTFTSTGTASVAENIPTSQVVYDANVSGATAPVFTLTGADAAAFNINATTGEVTFKASPDFETKSAYAINVVATEGSESATQAVAVTVTNVANEGPTFSSAATASVAENIPTTQTVYDADATGTGTVSFGITGQDAGAFNINTSTGVVTFKASPDFETKSSYSINVTATDSLGTTTKAVAISVTDVAVEGPQPAAITVSGAGTNSDGDLANTTYTVVLGNYEYTITGFDAGSDKIVGPAGVTPTIINPSFTDGEVTIQFAANNQIALITIEGITNAQDGQIFGVTSFNTVFGAGTIA
ncbi:MAG TPA: cadherin domain-containing protein [Novosphingobium sp.]|nr:cadherin domain-containing protein [Novosphingobium sp.]